MAFAQQKLAELTYLGRALNEGLERLPLHQSEWQTYLDWADGGVDLELRKDGELYLIHCKQWRATKVGVAIVHEPFEAMAAAGATGAYVVTSGVFTKEAQRFAEGRNITLVDGKALQGLISRAHDSKKPMVGNERPNSRPEGIHDRQEPTIAETDAVPQCPTCGGPMAAIGRSSWRKGLLYCLYSDGRQKEKSGIR